MQTSINGYVAQPDGKTDWMTWNPDAELTAFMAALLDNSDLLLLGRKTAEVIIPFWEKTAAENPDHPFAKKIATIPKLVFSKTLTKSLWSNTSLAKGALTKEVSQLKMQAGKGLLVFGGAGFVSSLIEEGLIDEYHFIVNPTAISSGMTVFNAFQGVRKFEPVQAKLYPGGKVVLTYHAEPEDNS